MVQWGWWKSFEELISECVEVQSQINRERCDKPWKLRRYVGRHACDQVSPHFYISYSTTPISRFTLSLDLANLHHARPRELLEVRLVCEAGLMRWRRSREWAQVLPQVRQTTPNIWEGGCQAKPVKSSSEVSETQGQNLTWIRACYIPITHQRSSRLLNPQKCPGACLSVFTTMHL